MIGTTARPRTDQIPALIDELIAIRAEMVEAAAAHRTALSGLHPDWRTSGRNSIHYLAVRRHDVRALQDRLAVHPR